MSKKVLPALLLHAALVLGAVITIVPLLWMVSASFMPQGQANTEPPQLLPSPPTLEHYETLFNRLAIGRTFANSLFLALVVTAGSLLFNSMAGYAFAKLRFSGRDRLFALTLVQLRLARWEHAA